MIICLFIEGIVSQQVWYCGLLVAVWVSLVNNTDSQATILESASSPVLFSEAGQIELSGQFYFVAINVNVEGLRDAIDPIAIALNEIAQGIK